MKRPNKRLSLFGKLVVTALVERNMRQVDLADAVGVSAKYLNLVLHGDRSGAKYRTAIIAVLELDPRKVEKAIAA